MDDNYQRCLANTLRFEGGYANHPRDPGGATMKGVTQRTYDNWRKRNGKKTQHVKAITESEMLAIYRGGYWLPVGGPDLPKGVDQVTFDAGVNSGPSRGIQWTARALGCTATVVSIVHHASKANDKVSVVKKACANRMSFVRGLGTWSVFGKGWSRRIATMEALGVKMVLEANNFNVKQGLEDEKKKAEAAVKKDQTTAGGAVVAGGGTAAVDPAMPWWGWVLLIALIAGAVVYSLYWYKNNKARVEAYKDALSGKLETTWDTIKQELEKRT